MKYRSLYTPTALALALSITSTASFSAPVETLLTPAEQRIQALEKRLLELESRLSTQDSGVATTAKINTTVSASDSGFSLKKDGYDLTFSALAQTDLRTFLSDDRVAGGSSGKLQDGFLLRRIRPTLAGNLGSLAAFRFTPEFAGTGSGDSSSVVDAYIDLKVLPNAIVRVGKQKSLIGIERIQSASALPFIERGLTTELVPNRNLGVSVFGDFADKAMSYSV
ncbi:MAG: porin, partial [Paraperlucidibaca sp.]